MRARRLTLAVASALALAGCSGILPKPLPPPALYRLTAARYFPATANALPLQLLIGPPAADAALDTTRIALSRSPTTLDYFADAAWTDRLPAVVKSRLVESFENAQVVAAVSGEAGAIRADVMLATELRHFEADYAGASPPRWRIEITADLVGLPDRRVIATRRFAGEAEARKNDMAAIVASADAAWQKVARQIVVWTADSLRHRAR